MQIWVAATTATTFPNGGVLAVANSHPLPSWAPQIAYIPTTTLLGPSALQMCDIYGPTTTGDVCILQRCVIRGYTASRFGVPMRVGSIETVSATSGAPAVTNRAAIEWVGREARVR